MLFNKNYATTNYSKAVQKIKKLSNKKTHKTTSSPDEFTSINVESMEMDGVTYDAFVTNIKIAFGGNIQSCSTSVSEYIILYVSSSSVDTIPDSLIRAVSMLSNDQNDYFTHRYFTKNLSAPSNEDINFHGYCNSFYNRDLIALLTNSFASSVCSSPTIVKVRRSSFIMQFDNLFAVKHLAPIIITGGGNYRQNGATYSCTCPNSNEGSCQSQTQENGTSIEGCDVGCLIRNVNTDYNPVALLAVKGAYDFRDGYLSNSDIGTKYIEYYYIISYFDHVLPNSITLASKYNFAVSCYNIANTLQNGSDPDIVISPAFKTSALSIISNYALLTNNLYFNEMLDDIRDDLNLYTGMSKFTLKQPFSRTIMNILAVPIYNWYCQYLF